MFQSAFIPKKQANPTSTQTLIIKAKDPEPEWAAIARTEPKVGPG
jgi:hypothetical protein